LQQKVNRRLHAAAVLPQQIKMPVASSTRRKKRKVKQDAAVTLDQHPLRGDAADQRPIRAASAAFFVLLLKNDGCTWQFEH
jgi:hypothetical protein